MCVSANCFAFSLEIPFSTKIPCPSLIAVTIELPARIVALSVVIALLKLQEYRKANRTIYLRIYFRALKLVNKPGSTIFIYFSSWASFFWASSFSCFLFQNHIASSLLLNSGVIFTFSSFIFYLVSLIVSTPGISFCPFSRQSCALPGPESLPPLQPALSSLINPHRTQKIHLCVNFVIFLGYLSFIRFRILRLCLRF